MLMRDRLLSRRRPIDRFQMHGDSDELCAGFSVQGAGISGRCVRAASMSVIRSGGSIEGTAMF
jgi:hypothetical protein